MKIKLFPVYTCLGAGIVMLLFDNPLIAEAQSMFLMGILLYLLISDKKD